MPDRTLEAEYKNTPMYAEKILMTYVSIKTMSVSDSRVLGEALGVLQRHSDEYMKEVERRVRNG